MWPFSKKHSVQGDSWLYWDYDDLDGLHGMTFIDDRFLEPEARTGFLREVQISLVFPPDLLITGAFPSPEGHGQASFLEDELVKRLQKAKVDCLMVVRCTYDGTRRFVFEMKDTAAFDRVVDEWKDGTGAFELHRRDEPAWVIYEELSPDEYNWARIMNRMLIQRLIDSGLDPRKEHLLEFAFSGDDQSRSALLSKATAIGGRSLGTNEGILDIGFEHELELEAICDRTYALIDLAADTGAKYEGWSVSKP